MTKVEGDEMPNLDEEGFSSSGTLGTQYSDFTTEGYSTWDNIIF